MASDIIRFMEILTRQNHISGTVLWQRRIGSARSLLNKRRFM